MTKAYDGLPLIIKVILQLIFGVLISGLYRIFKFVEKKNIVTLIVGIVALFTGIGNLIFWIIDLITTIVSGKITVLAD